jgi:hypothetical protein
MVFACALALMYQPTRGVTTIPFTTCTVADC